MVAQLAVNQLVAGSNPASGAKHVAASNNFSGLGVATLDIRKKENCHQETDNSPEVDTRAD